MKIIQKFIINHKFNNSTSQMIFYMVISIMIFMHTIVSVSTTETGTKMAETDIRIPTTTTILTKTLFDLSKNPVIAQQSSKTSQTPVTGTITRTTSSSAATSSSSAATSSPTILPLSSILISNNLSSATTIAAAAAASFNTPHNNNAPLSAKDTEMGACKSLSGVWGDVDPNIFYICDTNTKMPAKLRCPEGRGFFMGFGYSGCIPYEEWPACISSGHLEQVVLCDSEHMQQPWEAMNPNKFYVCLQETIEPTMLNCEQGKGFVHAVVNSNSGTGGGGGGGNRGGSGTNVISEIVGCANWEKWRSYMQCTDYY